MKGLLLAVFGALVFGSSVSAQERIDEVAAPFERDRDAAIERCDYPSAVSVQASLLRAVDVHLRDVFGMTLPPAFMVRRARIRNMLNDLRAMNAAASEADELLRETRTQIVGGNWEAAGHALSGRSGIMNLPACKANQLAEAATIVDQRLFKERIRPLEERRDEAVTACDYGSAVVAQTRLAEEADAFVATFLPEIAPAELLSSVQEFQDDLAELQRGAEAEAQARTQLEAVRALLASGRRQDAIAGLETALQIRDLPPCLHAEVSALLRDMTGPTSP